MPNQTSLEQIELVELTQTVDDGRVVGDPFKLPAASRALLNVRLADLQAKDVATLMSEGSRATASANVRAALDQLQTLPIPKWKEALNHFAILFEGRMPKILN